MSGIGGIIAFDDNCSSEGLDLIADKIAYRGTNDQGCWRDSSNKVGIVQSLLFTTPESLTETLPLVDGLRGLILVADARIDNRDELLALFGFTGDVSTIPDSVLILRAYDKWGRDCAYHLLGDFVFAIWDERKQRLFCARDHIGMRPFYYHWDGAGKRFVFCSEISGILSQGWVRGEVNQERVADLITIHVKNNSSTFYKDVYRLQPANWIEVSKDGVREEAYWSLDPQKEIRFRSDKEYEEAFFDLFEESVRCRLRSITPLSCSLSGGLDSSSVACVADKLLRNAGRGSIHTFTAVFPNLFEEQKKRVDEKRYVDAVLAHVQSEPHFVDAGVFNPLDILQKYSWAEPYPAFNGYLHEAIMQAVGKQGGRVLLDGEGGDDVVSYGVSKFYDLGRKFRLIKLATELYCWAQIAKERLVPWYCFKEYFVKVHLPQFLADRVRIFKQALGVRKIEYLEIALLNDAIRSAGMEQNYESNFKNYQRYKTSSRQKYIQGVLSPLTSYVMELYTVLAAKNRVEIRSPFLDRRLVEYCSAIPMDQKLRAGWPRSILRRSMRGVAPDAILARRSKADLSPHFDNVMANYGQKELSAVGQRTALFDKYVNLGVAESAFKHEKESRFTQKNSDNELIFILISLGSWCESIEKRSQAEGDLHTSLSGEGIQQL